jgi:hypothetical protein
MMQGRRGRSNTKGLGTYCCSEREGRTTTSAHVCGRTTAQDGLKRAIKCRGTKFPSKSTRTWKTSENEFHGYTTIYNITPRVAVKRVINNLKAN